MAEIDKELLQQALLEAEHLRQQEATSRIHAESLLAGLHLLSSAQSQQDSIQAVIAVLGSVLPDSAFAILLEDADGRVRSLGESTPSLRVTEGTAKGALVRGFAGRPAVLADSIAAGWWLSLQADGYAAYASALIKPVSPVDQSCVVVCLHPLGAQYDHSDVERLTYMAPLAAHAVRHALKLAELRDAISALDHARDLAETSARTDPLTGLANRMELEEATKRAAAEPEAEARLCLAMVDLDGFKPINDNFGHHAGDRVLIEVGQRLADLVKERGTVARIGGDEFGVLTMLEPGMSADAFGAALVDLFALPIDYEHHRLAIDASVGLVRYADVDGDLDFLRSAADAAMYSAKEQRESCFLLFDPKEGAPQQVLHGRRELMSALQKSEIVPHFQPQIDLETGALLGFEALARWRHPTRGLVSPNKFIPSIEATGLVAEFSYHTVRNVFLQMRAWRKSGLLLPRVSVNIAETNLATEAGTQDLLWLMHEFPEVQGNVTFEITEDVFINRSADRIKASIGQLIRAGAEISLDDFGTGYCSFLHLRELAFHELKIDTQFVAGIGKDRRAEVIIETFVEMALGLQTKIVAEGVETEEQAQFLRERHCAIGQGFLFGAAMDREATTAWLTQRYAAAGREVPKIA